MKHVPPPDLLALIRTLERELVGEGSPVERQARLAGGAVVEPEWPADLPPLTPELRAWFSWRENDPESTWRSAAWAVGVYRAQAAEPGAHASRVPVLGHHLIDVRDGALWRADLDDDGVRVHAPAPEETLPGLLLRMARGLGERRRSPWRRIRLAESAIALTRITDPPTAEALAAAEIGTVMIATIARRTYAWLKHTPSAWVEVQVLSSIAIAELSFDLWLDALREALATGTDEGKTVYDDAGAAAALARRVTRARGQPVDLRLGDAVIWEQPPLEELLARLGPALERVSPVARRALLPPAREAELAALEVQLGAPLPDDVRALWRTFGGQREPASLYGHARLLSPAEAARSGATMRALAVESFDVPGGPGYWEQGLLPLLDRGTGDVWCVDVTGAYGPPGGLWDFDHERPAHRTIHFASVAEWLECFVEGLEEDLYVAEEGGVHPRGFLASGLRTEVERHDIARTNRRFPWTRALVLRS